MGVFGDAEKHQGSVLLGQGIPKGVGLFAVVWIDKRGVRLRGKNSPERDLFRAGHGVNCCGREWCSCRGVLGQRQG